MIGFFFLASFNFCCCCCSVAKSCPDLCHPMDCSLPSFPVLHHLLEFSQTCVHRVSDAIQPSHPLNPLLPLPSIFPSIRIFSSELALHIRWPKYWSFSFSISPSSEYSGLISFRIDWLDLLVSKGLSRVFSSTTIWKHQFFRAQPYLWSNYHIRIWLLEKPQLWIYRPLSAKWCLCFLILYLGLSSLSFQGASVLWFHGCNHHPQWFWSQRKENLSLLLLFLLLFALKWWG